MSAVLHLPVLNTQVPYMLKEKAVETFAPAFTAVNGRGSPPSPRGSTSADGTSARQSPPQPYEQRPSENGYRSGNTFTDGSSGPSSPDSPKKRKRTDSPEEIRNTATDMEAPQRRPLPPIERPSAHERRRTAEPQSHNAYPETREPRPMEPGHGSLPPMNTPHLPMPEMNGFEWKKSAEANRASIQQINAKKRKRHFANRTKTGCGTCRRRKKKCDEAKPECTFKVSTF
jgi:hypothetical protein